MGHYVTLKHSIEYPIINRAKIWDTFRKQIQCAMNAQEILLIRSIQLNMKCVSGRA